MAELKIKIDATIEVSEPQPGRPGLLLDLRNGTIAICRGRCLFHTSIPVMITVHGMCRQRQTGNSQVEELEINTAAPDELMSSRAITNVGEAYDISTGESHCPADGHTSGSFLQGQSSSVPLRFESLTSKTQRRTVMKNSEAIVKAFNSNKPGSQHVDNASSTACLELQRGDHVSVVLPNGCHACGIGGTTSFTGFLISKAFSLLGLQEKHSSSLPGRTESSNAKQQESLVLRVIPSNLAYGHGPSQSHTGDRYPGCDAKEPKIFLVAVPLPLDQELEAMLDHIGPRRPGHHQ
ncbi:hypothetical protein D4764_03G0003300 [Takifugu flavidus]|uniref:C1q domain-containing protein n=1 Tax=Takifugu flavidus TaxID=433684 RepID=A0A5C6N787_9TELE|nr:hypothetical protein D4764_03G0003300 [Takifugu flavidus]